MPRRPSEFVNHPAGFREVDDLGLFRGHCHNVVDGDTADFLIDLGWMQYAYTAVRFLDVDTAEMRGTSGVEREFAERALRRVEELMLDRPVLIRSSKGTTFGRFVASIWFPAEGAAFPDLPNTIALDHGDGRVWVSIVDVLKAEGLTKADARAAAARAGEADPR